MDILKINITSKVGKFGYIEIVYGEKHDGVGRVYRVRRNFRGESVSIVELEDFIKTSKKHAFGFFERMKEERSDVREQ